MIAVAFALFVGSIGTFTIGISRGDVPGALYGLGFSMLTGAWVVWEVSRPHDDAL